MPRTHLFRLQLKLARYGDAPFERAQLDDIGLDPDEIPLAMELLLLIRNNDLRIADVLEGQRADAKTIAPQIETLRARVRTTRDMAYSILERLHARGTRGSASCRLRPSSHRDANSRRPDRGWMWIVLSNPLLLHCMPEWPAFVQIYRV